MILVAVDERAIDVEENGLDFHAMTSCRGFNNGSGPVSSPCST